MNGVVRVPIGPPGPPVNIQLSIPSTMKSTIALHSPLSRFTTWSAGHVNVGSSTSFTVTSNVQVTGLPKLSEALSVTVVVPTGKTAVVAASPVKSFVIGIPLQVGA